MSIKIVHEEIKRFLENDEPEVLCLKGKWGVGKTYAWNYFLKEAARKKGLGMNKYAYVSLFGLKSLEEVKYALFESTVADEAIVDGPSATTLDKGFTWVKKNLRKGAGLVSQNPLVKSYIGETEKSLFFLVRNQVICIDDLERASEGLDIKDVFGLISYLKEQRRCKVALLLNEEKIADKSVYDELLEKVVDTKLDFSPTPSEASDIVFPSPSDNQKLIHDNCVKLGITNIRIIKKIERIIKRFEEIFGKSSLLMPQVVRSGTLFAWSIYQPKEAPPLEFLGDFGRLNNLGLETDKVPESEKEWQQLMREYGHFQIDDFDKQILETIKSGYFNKDVLLIAGKKQLDEFDEAQVKNEFSQAWDLYHNSFDRNEKEVLDAIYSSAKKAAKFIEPSNMDATVVFLREFDRKEEAEDLIKTFIEARGTDKEVVDFENSFFSRELKDQNFATALKNNAESFKDSRSPAQVLEDVYLKRGWNPEDVHLINTLTSADFYNLFKKAKGIEMHRMVKMALDFGKYTDASVEMKSIAEKAMQALEKIGKETRLNAKRVSLRGIKVTPEK